MDPERNKEHENGGGSGLRGRDDALPKIVRTVKGADDKLVAFVREQPVAALLASVAVGYVIGRVLTRMG